MSLIEIFKRPAAGSQPDYVYPPYVSTQKRSPSRPLILLPHTLTEVTGPVFGHDKVGANDHNLLLQHEQPPIGERITVSGRVLDDHAMPVAHALIEMWQANSAGRYRHKNDKGTAPLDPHFTGCGRAMTDVDGRYRFITVKPGAYPWGNHHNAWRPAHIHFSLFGQAFATRLVTQMYFPGDPLLPFDPIFNSTADEKARQLLIAAFDWDTTVANFSLGYRFDIILRGRHATPLHL
ncbi:MAG: protocatechuate 3,4-dioxygenase subunit beta [Burkholderiales bacterium]